MQLVDSKLYIANMPPFHGEPRLRTFNGGRGRTSCNLISRCRQTSAAERLLALMVAAFVIAASPALLATVRSVVSIALQILVQIGHFGFIAFQIFGR